MEASKNPSYGNETRSKEEEDLVVRSMKKVKSNSEENSRKDMDIVTMEAMHEECDMETGGSIDIEKDSSPHKLSYKEMVLADGLGEQLTLAKVAQMVVEDYEQMDNMMEELDLNDAPFDPKPLMKSRWRSFKNDTSPRSFP